MTLTTSPKGCAHVGFMLTFAEVTAEAIVAVLVAMRRTRPD
jgi:hypothetical protein